MASMRRRARSLSRKFSAPMPMASALARSALESLSMLRLNALGVGCPVELKSDVNTLYLQSKSTQRIYIVDGIVSRIRKCAAVKLQNFSMSSSRGNTGDISCPTGTQEAESA